jgi:hypothetical protein
MDMVLSYYELKTSMPALIDIYGRSIVLSSLEEAKAAIIN